MESEDGNVEMETGNGVCRMKCGNEEMWKCGNGDCGNGVCRIKCGNEEIWKWSLWKWSL